VRDALEVADGSHKLFPDPQEADRWLMIGHTSGGRLLTIVVTQPDDLGSCFIVTGWPAGPSEQTLYERPGGNTDAKLSPV
jgi:hypothetical protein